MYKYLISFLALLFLSEMVMAQQRHMVGRCPTKEEFHGKESVTIDQLTFRLDDKNAPIEGDFQYARILQARVDNVHGNLYCVYSNNVTAYSKLSRHTYKTLTCSFSETDKENKKCEASSPKDCQVYCDKKE